MYTIQSNQNILIFLLVSKGSTRIKISGNQSDQTTSAEFIEKRRLALERFLKRIALHPILRNDKNFCEFLEQGINNIIIIMII